LPQRTTLWSCSSVHASRSTDFTRLIWVPMPLCMPEQRIQINIPRFQEAHRGCLLRLQSAHILLGSSFKRALIVCWFWAAWAGFGRRDITGQYTTIRCNDWRGIGKVKRIGGGRRRIGSDS
jgi:hypothetical protein